jgi:uncharacterized protein YyaL (SSP411 family)
MAPNRLAKEKSPYLLQHAHNPVDWYPWGKEAFAAARDSDRPIFLSIGYATCHWCHVMERESFEDPEVAALMNDAFINVKVDREERPDIDSIYMAVAQMATGRGGWPLTVVMTPDRKPFFAATYIPKRSRHGLRGMMDLIPQLSGVWRERRDEILNSAEEIRAALQRAATVDQRGGMLGRRTLGQGYQELLRSFDSHHGGFGQAPKFPTPHRLLFLLRYHHRTGDPQALSMVTRTLDAMRAGGVFDQVGFGFHRYSTDAEWLLPHFEKMLYDQALLLMAFTEAFQITGEERFRTAASEITEYVLRDLTSPEGGFYSAEDADSEGEEGKFYVWSVAELDEVLGPDDAEVARAAWGMETEGNFLDEATRRNTGTNIPFRPHTPERVAEDLGLESAELGRRLEGVRERLFTHRAGRIRPLLDDKVLTDWNALMIAALAKAGSALGSEDLTKASTRAAEVLWERMWEDGRLLHRYREGEAGIDGNLDDYAFLAWALVELHQATLDPSWLHRAVDVTERMLALFRDDETGALFFTPPGRTDLIVRQKEVYDGAIPSGNSVAAQVLVRLGRLTADARYEDLAQDIADGFSRSLEAQPSAHAFMLLSMELALGESQEVVIVGDGSDPETRGMLEVASAGYNPNRVLLLANGDQDLERLVPLVAEMPRIEGSSTAYLCRGFRCEAPVTSAEDLGALLEAGPD